MIEDSSQSKLLLYTTEDGRQRIEVILEEGTVWLNQNRMVELFQTTKQNISLHIRNIFAEGELTPDRVVKEYLTTATDGKKYQTRFYNLEVVIAVGYRIRSHRGTQFRQWATERLREYIVKGFALDDERLAEPGGMDYFDELLDRIRAIRASEKRFYQKIRDIYLLSADYDSANPLTQEFFATVQNKMLYAVTGKTAGELIESRARSTLPNMGLTTWKGAARGRVLSKADTTIAKNYLDADELSTLELLVGQYLDFAELQARRRKVMYMKDWLEKLHSFLELNDREILLHAGSISAELAKEIAHIEYDKFAETRKKREAEKEEDDLTNRVLRLTGKNNANQK